MRKLTQNTQADERERITLEEAMGRSNDGDELRMMVEGRVSGGNLSS